jgi:hypothetical protein
MSIGILIFAKGNDSFWQVTEYKKVRKPKKEDYDNFSYDAMADIIGIATSGESSYSLAFLFILNIIAIAIYVPISIQKGIKSDRIVLIAITSAILTLPFYIVSAIYEKSAING